MSLQLTYLEIRIRRFLAGAWDYFRYIVEEFRNEGRNDSNWIDAIKEVQPRHKLGSSK